MMCIEHTRHLRCFFFCTITEDISIHYEALTNQKFEQLKTTNIKSQQDISNSYKKLIILTTCNED
jgi:hypothetical protein